jgi:hypothetical protein
VLRGNPPQGADRCGPPGRRRAGHRRRAARPPAADVGQPGQPLLPGPRPLPGAGHPSPPWPGRQATACAAGRSGTAGPGQQPSPPREPVTLPTGPSRAAGERTHRLSRARRGDWPSQQGGKWS